MLLRNGLAGSIDGQCIPGGQVQFLVSVALGDDRCVIAGMAKFELVSEHDRCKKWRRTDGVFLCTADNVRCATSWSEPAVGRVTTLNPIAA